MILMRKSFGNHEKCFWAGDRMLVMGDGWLRGLVC